MHRVPMGQVLLAILRRPWLWVEALTAGLALARRRWWRSWPFLPAPDTSYLNWRIATAYGSSQAAVSSDDVVAYLEWRRRQRRR